MRNLKLRHPLQLPVVTTGRTINNANETNYIHESNASESMNSLGSDKTPQIQGTRSSYALMKSGGRVSNGTPYLTKGVTTVSPQNSNLTVWGQSRTKMKQLPKTSGISQDNLKDNTNYEVPDQYK